MAAVVVEDAAALRAVEDAVALRMADDAVALRMADDEIEDYVDELLRCSYVERHRVAHDSRAALEAASGVVDEALVYGEFDMLEFFRYVDTAEGLLSRRPVDARGDSRALRVADVGSGTGRLCLGLAARRTGDYAVTGVEIQAELHAIALAANGLGASGVTFLRGDLSDPATATASVGTADIVFVYSTCMPADGAKCVPVDDANCLSSDLSLALLAAPRDTVVITTDRTLADDDFTLLLAELDQVSEVSESSVDVYFWRRR